MTTIDIFAPITKREKDPDTGFVTVYGKMTGPGLDLDEQRMDPTWLAKAVPEWFESGANVREMHKTSAVGKGIELTQIGDDYYLKSLVVDAEAIKKVDAGVYTGYSITVRGPRIIKDASAPGGRIVGGMIPETSLVDRPCLPSAKFVLAKSIDGAAEELEPRVIGGYLLTKDITEMSTGGDAEGESIDLIGIARDALNQWLAEEAAEVASGTGGRMVVRLICDVLSNLDWAVEADAYDDALAALDALETVIASASSADGTDIELSLTRADKGAVTELRKALGATATPIPTELAADVTTRLAQVEATVAKAGPVRVTTARDVAKTTHDVELSDRAARYRQLASTVTSRDQAAAYAQLAEDLETQLLQKGPR